MEVMTIPHPARLRRTVVALAATTVLALSGCGEDESTTSGEPKESASASPTTKPEKSPKPSPSTSDGAATTVEVEVAGSEVTPLAETVEIGVGEPLVLAISSDRIGELHVHSTPEKELSFEAGESRLQVTFDQPGSVDIEEHESGVLLFRVLVK